MCVHVVCVCVCVCMCMLYVCVYVHVCVCACVLHCGLAGYTVNSGADCHPTKGFLSTWREVT